MQPILITRERVSRAKCNDVTNKAQIELEKEAKNEKIETASCFRKNIMLIAVAEKFFACQLVIIIVKMRGEQMISK